MTQGERRVESVNAGPQVAVGLEGDITGLLAALDSATWAERRRAEDGLRRLGAAAVPGLVRTLAAPSVRARWGAAKVLGDVRDASAAPALVTALEDSDGGVRWLAGQALVAIGSQAVLPLLRQLLIGADRPWLQEGAHHVLRSLAVPAVTPVIHALEEHFPELTVPVAANEALKTIEAAAS